MTYILEVADLFLARCHDKIILSPMDFVTIAEWEKEEIPLEVVLGAINEMCDRGAQISSASGCQNAVRQYFGEWLKMRADQSSDPE